MEYLKIASLACFCAICNNGFDMFLSYSAVVQDSPFPPIGWNILQAGLKRSFLSSVYFSTFHECGCHNSSHGMTAYYLNLTNETSKHLVYHKSPVLTEQLVIGLYQYFIVDGSCHHHEQKLGTLCFT